LENKERKDRQLSTTGFRTRDLVVSKLVFKARKTICLGVGLGLVTSLHLCPWLQLLQL